MSAGRAARAGFATLLALLYLSPFLFMLRTSLEPRAGGAFPDFGHYAALLADLRVLRFTANSLVVTLVILAGNLLFASMVGYAFSRGRFRGKDRLFVLLLATLMVPKQVLMVPLYLLVVRMRMIDTYAALTVPFLVDAMNVFLMRQVIASIPTDLEDAARIDGAGELAIFFRVVMPLAAPGLAVVAVTTFIAHWNDFLYPLLFTSRESMRTLPVGLALLSQGEHSVDWPRLMAGAAIATAPVLALFVFFQKRIVEGLLKGGMTG
jgi:multiple sugar transport system permease protein